MFLEYFGLREQPFGVTPDPRYLYFGAMHREALASLFYGIETGCGFMTLIAPPGMGKTTLLLHLLERLRRSTRTVFLFQTQCDSREFFRYLLTDLAVDANNLDMAQMHEALNCVLLSNARMGRRFVLIIDEAQNLKRTVLETVRLLSDFETPAAKLMQIVLSGQPQLADRLSHPDLMQLRQRISIVSRLNPFSRVEMMNYIHHRLNVAGYAGPPLFNYDAIDQILAHSDGVPRNINNICFNALTLCYAKRQKLIDGSIVSEVLADLDMHSLMALSEVPAVATQDSALSVNGLEPTDEASYQHFHSAAHAAWVKGVEDRGIREVSKSDPVPVPPGGDSNAVVAVSERDSSELMGAESPPGQKSVTAEEIVATILGSLPARPAARQVPQMPDGPEMPIEKAQNAEEDSTQELSSQVEAQTEQDFTPPAGVVASATTTSPDPSVVSAGCTEPMSAVTHDSSLAPEIAKIEIPEETSVVTPWFKIAPQARLEPPANATVLNLFPTTAQSGTDKLKAHDSEPRQQWKFRKWIIACVVMLFVAGVSGVTFVIHKSVVEGVSDSTLATAAEASQTSNAVVHADAGNENFKTITATSVKDTIPSFRMQRQQPILSVTADKFGAQNALPASTPPAAEPQAANASSLDAALVFSGKKVNEPPDIVSSTVGVVLPAPVRGPDGRFSFEGQVKQPELLYRIPPEYPPAAKLMAIEGDVVVDCVIEKSGNVSDMKIVSGPQMLRQAALDALSSWKYKPSEFAGQPIAVKMQVTIGFHLP
jgi:general secretion pathway protein A